MDTVDLGGVRLHVLAVWPGLPGEADRVARELGALDPAVVLLDLDTEGALRLRGAVGASPAPFEPAFVDALFQEQVTARYGKDALPGEHPLVAAARVARNRDATLVPLRPTTKDPGFFDRRRANRAAQAIPDGKIDGFGAAYARTLKAESVWDADADADAAWPRLTRALTDGRAPLACLTQAHRAEPLLDRLRNTQRVAP